MREEAKIKEQPAWEAGGYAQRLWDFFKLLEETGDKKEKVRAVSGELKGPLDSKAAYGYTVKLGIEKNDFLFKGLSHSCHCLPAHVGLTRAKNTVAESQIDVFDGTQMPSAKKKI